MLGLYYHINGLKSSQDIGFKYIEGMETELGKMFQKFDTIGWTPPNELVAFRDNIRNIAAKAEQEREEYIKRLEKAYEGTILTTINPQGNLVNYLMRQLTAYAPLDDPERLAKAGAVHGEPGRKTVAISCRHVWHTNRDRFY